MNAYYENQKLKELQKQTEQLIDLTTVLTTTLETIRHNAELQELVKKVDKITEDLKYNTDLKQKMLEMFREDAALKEKMRKYRDEV